MVIVLLFLIPDHAEQDISVLLQLFFNRLCVQSVGPDDHVAAASAAPIGGNVGDVGIKGLEDLADVRQEVLDSLKLK